jgi:rhodanese-related sulfurtransferase
VNRIIVGLMAIVLLAGVSLLAAPVITAGGAVYDFGTVIEGAFVTHTFVLTNSGDATLTITRVTTSCGCTTTDLSQTSLAPGDSVNLDVNFDSVGFGGQTVTKLIYVESNDPTQPKFVLQLKGNVNRAQPYNIACGDLNYLFYLLVDLRDQDSYASSHMLGAVNIPYSELTDWMDRLPTGVLIVLYDEDGTKSDQAAQMLNKNGFPEAKSLLGGFDEWTRIFKDKFVISDQDK